MSTNVKKPLTEKQHTKRTITIALIVMVALVVAAVAGAIAYSKYLNNGGPQRRLISFETENYEVNNCMFTYCYLNAVYNAKDGYGAMLANMAPSQTAPDFTMSLSTQYYDYGTQSGQAQTWHEYFINMAANQIQSDLCYAEEAIANKFEYKDLDKDIDEYIESLKDTAKKEKLDLDKYLKKLYGNAVKEQDVRDVLELQIFAAKYKEKINDDKSAAVTDKQLDAYKKDNAADIETVNYYSFEFGNISSEDAANVTDDQKDQISAQASNDADTLLEKINAAEGMDAKIEAFKTFVKDHLTALNSAEDVTDPLTEEELEAEIESKTAESKDKKYDDANDFGDWAFKDGHKAGEAVKVETGSGIYTVFLLTKEAGTDDSATKNVHHILLTEDKYGSDKKAKAKAEEVLAEYNKGKKGAEAFEAVAEKYNEDGSSFYENVTEGTMVAEFNDWLFDAARKEGDTDIVKTEYGYHVMYFDGDGVAKWKADAISSIVSEAMTEYETKMIEKRKDDIKINTDNLWKISDTVPASAIADETTTLAGGTAPIETAPVEHDHDGDGVADHDASAHDTSAETTVADATEPAEETTVADETTVESDTTAA
ncbi:MAG: hypothetical protein E7652_08710 [Ruminococcaceae bacterium]|nr:hypothetical protein [Oscillospiraceae bacterium]